MSQNQGHSRDRRQAGASSRTAAGSAANPNPRPGPLPPSYSSTHPPSLQSHPQHSRFVPRPETSFGSGSLSSSVPQPPQGPGSLHPGGATFNTRSARYPPSHVPHLDSSQQLPSPTGPCLPPRHHPPFQSQRPPAPPGTSQQGRSQPYPSGSQSTRPSWDPSGSQRAHPGQQGGPYVPPSAMPHVVASQGLVPDVAQTDFRSLLATEEGRSAMRLLSPDNIASVAASCQRTSPPSTSSRKRKFAPPQDAQFLAAEKGVSGRAHFSKEDPRSREEKQRTFREVSEQTGWKGDGGLVEEVVAKQATFGVPMLPPDPLRAQKYRFKSPQSPGSQARRQVARDAKSQAKASQSQAGSTGDGVDPERTSKRPRHTSESPHGGLRAPVVPRPAAPAPAPSPDPTPAPSPDPAPTTDSPPFPSQSQTTPPLPTTRRYRTTVEDVTDEDSEDEDGPAAERDYNNAYEQEKDPELVPSARDPLSVKLDKYNRVVLDGLYEPSRGEGSTSPPPFDSEAEEPDGLGLVVTYANLFDLPSYSGIPTRDEFRDFGWDTSTYYKEGGLRQALTGDEILAVGGLVDSVQNSRVLWERLVGTLGDLEAFDTVFTRVLKNMCVMCWDTEGMYCTREEVEGQSLQIFLKRIMKEKVLPAVTLIATGTIKFLHRLWADGELPLPALPSYRPHVAVGLFEKLLQQVLVTPVVDKVEKQMQTLDIKRLCLVVRRSRQPGLHPNWGSAEGKTIPEFAAMGVEIMDNGTNLHHVVDLQAIQTLSLSDDMDLRPAATNQRAKVVNQMFSTAYQQSLPDLHYQPNAVLKATTGSPIAAHVNWASNWMICCFLRRKRCTLEEDEAYLLYLKRLLDALVKWDINSPDPDLLIFLLACAAADSAEAIFYRSLAGDDPNILDHLDQYPDLVKCCAAYRFVFLFLYSLGVQKFATDPAYAPEYKEVRALYIKLLKAMLEEEEQNPYGSFYDRVFNAAVVGSQIGEADLRTPADQEFLVLEQATRSQPSLSLAALPGFLRHRRSTSAEWQVPRGMLWSPQSRILALDGVVTQDLLEMVSRPTAPNSSEAEV